MKRNFSRITVALERERGFTILLSALVASLVLALGISVFSIAQKQLILSSIGRTSQLAFYAADTAAECGLYWDMRFAYFATTAPSGVDPICDGEMLSPTGHSPTLPYTVSFEFEPSGYCARVDVTKSTTHPRTRIHADGFNVSCADIETSARTLQRSVELTY